MPVPPDLRAVVFDLDGLMFNTEELYQYVGGELLRRRGKTFETGLLDQMMGRPPRVALQLMIDWNGLTETPAQLAAETEAIFPEILDARLECMPGLMDLLDALEEHRIPKAIATSSGRKFVTGVLARFAFEPRFEFILTAEDVVEGKPHPEIYLQAAQRFGVPPAQVLVLEDSENGCKAAVAAGTFAVAVPGGHSCRHDFSGTTMQVNTLADARIYEALRIPPRRKNDRVA
jgi:HAD superfamily hydrolase (TIGR01509 family)